jgi:hypothetical protein
VFRDHRAQFFRIQRCDAINHPHAIRVDVVIQYFRYKGRRYLYQKQDSFSHCLRIRIA